MHRFLVIIEKAGKNFSAYCPDLPGCVATGDTYPEAEALMREALKLHIDGLRKEGLPVPEPAAQAEYMAL
jgi:predicted RNase H-like HicB family nuclease